MANSILITGGASSGKSRFAVTSFAAFDYVLYLRIEDEINPDITNRIAYNSKNYGVEWDVVCKKTLSPSEEVKDHKFAIFDSVAAYTRNVISNTCHSIEDLTEDTKKAIEKRVIDEIKMFCDKVVENRGQCIIITLETGFSVKPADKGEAIYRDILGRINQRIAHTSDEAYFSVSGIQFKIR